MSADLLPLLMGGPLLLAGLLVMWPHKILERVLLLTVPVVSILAGVSLLLQHRTEPVIAHQVGGYIPGVAIPFVSDTMSALMLVVTASAALACVWFLMVTREDRIRFVPPLILVMLGGVNGALLTGDLFNFFVMVEVMVLPSYALIAVTGTWRRLGVGRTFVVVNLLTSSVLVTGVGLVYATTGSVNLAVLVGAANEDLSAAIAGAMVILALAVKGAMVPVHGWLPATYPGTSAGIMALFSALHTKVAIYAIYRVYSTLYEGQAPWVLALTLLVALTIVVGSYATFGEHIVRRALAWQMIAGVGHILIGVVLFTQLALAAGVFYMLHHIVTMGALLLLAGAIEQVYGSGRYSRLSGLMHRDQATAILFVFALFSLVGLPPSAGFFGKVGLIQATAAAQTWEGWLMLTLVLVGAVASLIAMQRMWAGVFWGPPMETYRPDRDGPGRARSVPLTPDVRVTRALLAPGAALVVLQLAMFVFAGPLMALSRRAADGLLDPSAYIQAVLG